MFGIIIFLKTPAIPLILFGPFQKVSAFFFSPPPSLPFSFLCTLEFDAFFYVFCFFPSPPPLPNDKIAKGKKSRKDSCPENISLPEKKNESIRRRQKTF